MDLSLTHLRVLRTVADRGSITAAAQDLGYTQSAVSRQVAALERSIGAELVQRLPSGVRLTDAGVVVLRHARAVFDELDAIGHDLAAVPAEREPVRLGMYISAGAVVLPALLAALTREHPDVAVISREGTTPSLVRSLRAGTLDLAVITSRPPFRSPDLELPRLVLTTLTETNLRVAVAASSRLATRRTVDVEDLLDVDWIGSPPAGTDNLLGVWPELPGRPRVVHTARDWLTKLNLVAAGAGVTTMPANLFHAVPDGVVLLEVNGAEQRRRMSLARLPGPATHGQRAVRSSLRRVVTSER